MLVELKKLMQFRTNCVADTESFSKKCYPALVLLAITSKVGMIDVRSW